MLNQNHKPGLYLAALIALIVVLATGAAGATRAGATNPLQATRSIPVTQPSLKITEELREEFRRAGAGQVRYVVVLSRQADLTNSIRDWNANGRFVLSALQKVAADTQPPVAAALAQQKAAGNISTFKSYYIINGFGVRGNLVSAEALANLSDVARIEAFPQITIDPTFQAAEVDAPTAIEWNVSIVRAPQAWARGYDGRGMTVGSLDTGARYTHNAIVGKYRGNLGGGAFDHNYNWWPSIGGSRSPIDENGHGTHTIGTILGDDGAGNQTGVAPGARWIATNGIADGVTDADIIEGGQWMLAPWDLNGQNPDPSKRPVAVSNSWGYGTNLPFPGCSTATFYRDIVHAWSAAGIFPSFSAGNGTYGNRPPAAYPETFETGSINSLRLRSYFSSQGPSCFDGGQHPQVMAGGEGVRSASHGSDTGYTSLSGTSMAQPALAGAVAILKQANPDLTIQETWYILTSTAVMDPAWGAAPDIQYGWGLLQIDRAVDAALARVTPTATVTGTPPTASPTSTPTNTFTPTPVPPTATPTTPPACVQTYVSTDVPRPIPDLLTVTSSLTVPNGQTIASVEVTGLTFTHTYPEDMNVFLISPSGTRVKLFSDVCAGGDWTLLNTGFDLSDGAANNLGLTCPPGTGSYRPASPLSAFAGESSTGTWVLEITDDTLQDMGMLHGWGLSIGSNTPCGPPTETPVATSTPEPTQTPLPTSTPTNTPEPCSACNLTVGSVTFTCNLDGAIHWTATVQNNSTCTVTTGWQAQLQTKQQGGKFQYATHVGDTSSFAPGANVLEGTICYLYPNGVTHQRVILAVDSGGDGCKLGGKSDVAGPCGAGASCDKP